MNARIKSVKIRDFRSIRGEITIPLDSPVVLIHGPNGAGKTSLLSALELGLTGHLASLAKFDASVGEHLIHKEATDASISVTVAGVPGAQAGGEFFIKPGAINGTPLLPSNLVRFYTERCYLAQSTLGRLLEIYQNKDVGLTDSPLTLFVKDLLGLDALDALIEGLHDAGDVRRLRGGANQYWEVRDQIPGVEDELKRLEKDATGAESRAKQLRQGLKTQVATFWPNQKDSSAAELGVFLGGQSAEPDLRRLARIRRDISATLDQWTSVESPVAPNAREAAERAATEAAAALEHWRSTSGEALKRLFEELANLFSDLPSPTGTSPEHARATAQAIVSAEIERASHVLTRDAVAVTQLASIDSDIGRLTARLSAIDGQIAQYSANTGQLAQALSALLPHIHTQDCPVCSRDFSEVSDVPLAGHVASKIASLTQNAGRLEALAREKAEASASLAKQTRARSISAGQVMASEPRNQLKTRVAQLTDFASSLDSLQEKSVRGEQLLQANSKAAAELNALRARDQRATSIREAAGSLAQSVGVDAIGPSEPLSDALQRFLKHVQGHEEQLSAREAARREAAATVTELSAAEESLKALNAAIDSKRSLLGRLIDARTAADRRIEQARALASESRAERTRIVRRVFNESLNAVWRDLFVRLAPEEPFVPAFALPDSPRGAVEAKLETLYRSGAKGGNPRAMLSAGNLNTAALTLFLALHLSVRPVLPWLVIDDPVQSMDEVHISQFAALLRTLSKQHGRQLIIAVHEKPLFDYLALELSPAFPNDRLVTIELGRTANDLTVIDYKPKTWEQDLAVAA